MLRKRAETSSSLTMCSVLCNVYDDSNSKHLHCGNSDNQPLTGYVYLGTVLLCFVLLNTDCTPGTGLIKASKEFLNVGSAQVTFTNEKQCLQVMVCGTQHTVGIGCAFL